VRDEPRYVARWELDGVSGVVVVVDVLRAFTTAAYAIAGGANAVWLVATVDEALVLAREIPHALTMGEDGGVRPDVFDFSNSPVHVSEADVAGRDLIQRTSAGTQGAVAAHDANRLFAASLVCASATADAIVSAGLGAPTYVITGRFPNSPNGGEDDLATAQLIERARCGKDLESDATSALVASSSWARKLASLSAVDVHPSDVSYATVVDRFDFAMEVERIDTRLRLVKCEAESVA
jgi:2-phosphosulfolactate phosphatase